MKIIVLSITQYKEKDGIIDAISEQGSITFLAKGIMDPKNKNSAINNALVIADIELNEGNYKYPVLKTASITFTPMKTSNSYYYLSSLLFIGEVTKTLLQDEEKIEIFETLADAVQKLKTTDNPWPIVLVYLAKLLTIGGYEFEVNQCVFCGTKKEIVAFSFKDGGFVCKNCLEADTERDLTKTQMLLIRSAFNNKNIKEANFECTKEDAIVVLNKFNEFIVDSYGLNLKCFDLLNK